VAHGVWGFLKLQIGSKMKTGCRWVQKVGALLCDWGKKFLGDGADGWCRPRGFISPGQERTKRRKKVEKGGGGGGQGADG